MRAGQNPLRFSQAPASIRDIVFVVVTHLPCEESPGYHAGRMDVVKACLQTMRWGAHREHTFMVWDNGSKSEFRDWLQHIFEPDILVMSENIGKNNARAAAVNMLPLSSVICYSDDDMLYYDNWLNPQIELLNHFPGVAAVSGYPLRVMFRWGVENTIAWARKNGKLEQGRFMPKEWDVDYCDSVGQDYQAFVQKSVKDIDYRVSYQGRQAYCTAHHCQFIGYGVKLQQALTFDQMAMGDEKQTDIALDQVGLRLSTTRRLARHMGNVLDGKLQSEKAGMEMAQK